MLFYEFEGGFGSQPFDAVRVEICAYQNTYVDELFVCDLAFLEHFVELYNFGDDIDIDIFAGQLSQHDRQGGAPLLGAAGLQRPADPRQGAG